MYGYGINILSAVTVLIIKFRAGVNGYLNNDDASGVIDTRIKVFLNRATLIYYGGMRMKRSLNLI